MTTLKEKETTTVIQTAPEATFYNQERKEEYLSNFQGDSKTTYARILSLSKKKEEEFDKDLSSFNLREIESFLHICNPRTIASSKHNAHIVSSYIRWSIRNRYKNGSNPLDNVESKWYTSFVDQEKEMFISEKELESIENGLHNYQDKIIPRLNWEGVGGEGCAELLNLKRKDVDFATNTLTLTDEDKNKRKLVVSDRTMDFIRKALGENDYLKKNGDLTPTIKATHTNLVQSDFVIRSSTTRNEDSTGAAKIHTIYRRLQMIAEQFDKPYLNTTNLQRSGMLKMAKDLLERDGVLEKKQYDEISERYDVSKSLNGGFKLDYNYYPLKEFITIETIEKLYGSLVL